MDIFIMGKTACEDKKKNAYIFKILEFSSQRRSSNPGVEDT